MEKIYVKLLVNKSNQFNIIDFYGEVSKETCNNIIFLTTKKEKLNNLSVIIHEVEVINSNNFLYYIKNCTRLSNTYRNCKIIENKYKAFNEEFYVRIIKNNYLNFISYIDNKVKIFNDNPDNYIKKNKNFFPDINDKKSIYRGVRRTKYNHYLSVINKDFNRYYLGSYPTEELAAYAYNCMAKELYGEKYKYLNIVEKPLEYEWSLEKKRLQKI